MYRIWKVSCTFERKSTMPEGSQLYAPHATPRDDRRLVTADEYAQYHSQGFLVAKALVSDAEVAELKQHAMDLYDHKVKHESEYAAHGGVDRAHMLHRVDGTMERFLLHRRVLDVVEALQGPDVLALQTMQFYNRPAAREVEEDEHGGQGWHQDSKYIATYPDTLIGTWLALDTADEENGCLWVVPGTSNQPIFPEVGDNIANVHATGAFDIEPVANTSHLDDSVNTLSRVAHQYGEESWLPVRVDPGDVPPPAKPKRHHTPCACARVATTLC